MLFILISLFAAYPAVNSLNKGSVLSKHYANNQRDILMRRKSKIFRFFPWNKNFEKKLRKVKSHFFESLSESIRVFAVAIKMTEPS
jgi:hypothetical protein